MTELSQDTLRRLSGALPPVIRMMNEWHLTPEDQADTLDVDVRIIRRGHETLSQVQVTRMSLIAGLYQALARVFPPLTAAVWITRSWSEAPFVGRSPLEYARETGTIGIHTIRELLDTGNFGITAEDRRAASSLTQPDFDLT